MDEYLGRTDNFGKSEIRKEFDPRRKTVNEINDILDKIKIYYLENKNRQLCLVVNQLKDKAEKYNKLKELEKERNSMLAD